MKRDMDLIREILFAVEKHDDKSGWIRVVIEGHSNEEVNYHLLLLKDAGFMEAAVMGTPGPHRTGRADGWAG